jgi:hypothetical protein
VAAGADDYGTGTVCGYERVVQPSGESEVPQMVDRELWLSAETGVFQWSAHHAGLVDQ